LRFRAHWDSFRPWRKSKRNGRLAFLHLLRPDTAKRSPVAKHRSRKARAGFVRVEISVRKEDAPLVRQVAAALTDPTRRADARALLRRRFLAPAGSSLKELLATAPLDGIDLERARDFGRDIDV
jgi:hypothetical protein